MVKMYPKEKKNHEDNSKSLVLQHRERSELRFHFKSKMPKMVTLLGEFLKN